MPKYAEKTSVPAEQSRAEIERTLERYGASKFAYAWAGENAVIVFEMMERRVKFVLPLPDKNSNEFTQTPTGKDRSATEAQKAYAQAVRQRWRALALAIKAKLETVETGISEFEAEFLAHIVLPNGSTVEQFIRPQIETAYKTKKMPPLLITGM